MIPSKYQLIAFANKEHGKPTLWVVGALSYLATLLATQDHANASLTFRHIAQKKNIKSGLRRVAWYLRRSWARINLINDTNYDFTQDLTPDEIQQIERFLSARKASIPPQRYLADKLYLHAYHIHHDARNRHINHTQIKAYQEAADTLYAHILSHHSQLHKTEDTVVSPTPQTYPKENVFTHNATQILAQFARLVPKEQYPWHIISGTLLGLHRENGFLPHDVDIDLAIDREGIDMDLLIQTLHTIPDMSIKNITSIPIIEIQGDQINYSEKEGIIKLLHHSGIQIDVFINHHIGDKVIHGSKIHQWQNTPYGLTTRILAGTEVYCPDIPERYLEENYGEWETPVTEFSCSTGTPNMTIVSNFYSIAFFIRKLLTHLEQHELTEYAKTLHILKQQNIIQDNKVVLPFVKS